MSVDAARVVVKKREQDRAACDIRFADCEARAKKAERGQAFETKRSDSNAWWSTYGPPLTIGGACGWALAIALTILVAKK